MSTHAIPKHPPDLSETQLDALITEAKDWQLTHGSLLKLVLREQENTVPAVPIGVALFPTLFPRRLFAEAADLQQCFNQLYMAIAEDDAWLEQALGSLIESDHLVKTLWRIHCQVRSEGFAQTLNLGVFRSDYMLHCPLNSDGDQPSLVAAELKQVEVNTVSVAGGTHGNLVANMQRAFATRGIYEDLAGASCDPLTLPINETIQSIVDALEKGHRSYDSLQGAELTGIGSRGPCVIFLVQPYNVNICDERPLEYALWERGIPTFRVIFGKNDQLRVDASRKLLYYPPEQVTSNPWEVSVVYIRAGYDSSEYDEHGTRMRLDIERSCAIKCPPITCHLATLKAVQQALTAPGAVERFLPAEQAARVRTTFMPMYLLDDSVHGKEARALAVDPELAASFVLKPSLEGGGHNVYRSEISAFLAQTPEERWHDYILMEMISSPPLENILLSPAGLYRGPVISELGIFGACLWRRSEEPSHSTTATSPSEHKVPPSLDIISNENAGWSLKTKSKDVNEMSVVKGFGCFDSPLLFDG